MIFKNSINKQRIKQKGFTLIELIVALSIMTLLAVTGYKAVKTTLNIRENIAKRSELLREFELGLFMLSRDLSQIQLRPIPLGKRPFYSMNLGVQKRSEQAKTLFSFYQSSDAQMVRGIQLSEYQFTDGALIQKQNIEGKVFKTPILSHLKTIEISFYDKNQNKIEYGERQGQGQSIGLPTLIELRFNHEFYGENIFKQVLVY